GEALSFPNNGARIPNSPSKIGSKNALPDTHAQSVIHGKSHGAFRARRPPPGPPLSPRNAPARSAPAARFAPTPASTRTLAGPHPHDRAPSAQSPATPRKPRSIDDPAAR